MTYLIFGPFLAHLDSGDLYCKDELRRYCNEMYSEGRIKKVGIKWSTALNLGTDAEGKLQ
jgi:hypothetical protein